MTEGEKKINDCVRVWCGKYINDSLVSQAKFIVSSITREYLRNERESVVLSAGVRESSRDT